MIFSAIRKGNSNVEFLRALLAETILLCDLILLADGDDNANNNIGEREKKKREIKTFSAPFSWTFYI